MHLTQNCPGRRASTARPLTLGFTNAGARDSFVNGGCDEILRQAAIDVVGADWRIEAIVDPGATAARPHTVVSPRSPRGARAARRSRSSPRSPPRPRHRPAEPPVADDAAAGPEPPVDEAAPARRTADPQSIAAAREASPRSARPPTTPEQRRALADADAHPDDPDADDRRPLDTAELLERELGARVIEEIPRS